MCFYFVKLLGTLYNDSFSLLFITFYWFFLYRSWSRSYTKKETLTIYDYHSTPLTTSIVFNVIIYAENIIINCHLKCLYIFCFFKFILITDFFFSLTMIYIYNFLFDFFFKVLLLWWCNNVAKFYIYGLL